jgi:uncharacterized protein (TIGR03435 family)
MVNGTMEHAGSAHLPAAAMLLVCVSASVCAQGNSAPVKAQGPSASLPQFDAASVRPSDGNELNGYRIYPGGRVIGKGCRLQYLLMLAFNVERFQIAGEPGWADLVTGEGFDIQAVPPADSASTHLNPAFSKDLPNDEERRMLLALLVDRFQLRYHIESREGQVYRLERGKNDLKLLPPKDKTGYPWAGPIAGGWVRGGMQGQNISMAQLAEYLRRRTERPVMDQTGLQGSFDFEYRNNDEQNDADITGFLITAMKAIGLELKSSKGRIETIVIDHVEKPSPN